MVGKRGRCGHWLPAFDTHFRCYSCRKNAKGEDSCASSAPVEACTTCASLTEVEWNHLRSVFTERSAKHANKSVPADTPALVGPAPDTEEDPGAGEIDDSILDLNQDDQLAGTGHRHLSTGWSLSTAAGYIYQRLDLLTACFQYT